jgi:hypothetical protein
MLFGVFCAEILRHHVTHYGLLTFSIFSIALEQLELERRRSLSLVEELGRVKERSAAVQNAYENEEEFIANRLLTRLDQLKADRAALVAQVEAEEEFLVNQLQHRLAHVHDEKSQVESRLANEQESAMTLKRQLKMLSDERVRLMHEKADLENILEAEQEYISLKLTKQVEKMALEKESLVREKVELARQVEELSSAVERVRREKVALEAALEAEEEAAVNRLQRQLQQVTTAYRALEAKLEAHGVSPRSLDGTPALDPTTEWIYSHHGGSGRCASRSSDRLLGSRRERSLSVSSSSSMRDTSHGRSAFMDGGLFSSHGVGTLTSGHGHVYPPPPVMFGNTLNSQQSASSSPAHRERVGKDSSMLMGDVFHTQAS